MTPIDSFMNKVDWQATCSPEDVAMADQDTPWVTHTGILSIGEFTFRCYQLSDGERVIDAEDVETFFGLSSNVEQVADHA